MATCPRCRTHYADDVPECAKDGETLVPDRVMEQVARNEIQPGAMIGEYRVEKQIGEGGFGAVFAAVQPIIGKPVAIKVLSRAFSDDPAIVSRFIAEARAVNQIRHKNIVDIFSFGALPDGRQYFVMELLSGEPLDDRLRKQGCFELADVMPILRGVLRALAAAHGKGLIHRDLKPENVFLAVDDEGAITPKLIDFGIAKLLGDESREHRTRTGTPIGTPYFMSPEQCRGKNVDHRTDIYSVGAMLHMLLTGRRPFDGDSAMDVLYKQMVDAPPRLSDHRKGFPAALEEFVARMMSKDADKRPQTITEVLKTLEELAGTTGRASIPILPPGGFGKGESVADIEAAKTSIGGPSLTEEAAPISTEIASRVLPPAEKPAKTVKTVADAPVRTDRPAQGSRVLTIAGVAAVVFGLSLGVYFVVRPPSTSATPTASTDGAASAPPPPSARASGAPAPREQPGPAPSPAGPDARSSGLAAGTSTEAPKPGVSMSLPVGPVKSALPKVLPHPTFDPNEVTNDK